MTMQASLFPTRGETIEQEKAVFNKKMMNDGEAHCPCCNRDATVSKQRVHATLAYMLGRLYAASMEEYGQSDGWVHLEKFSPGRHGSGREFAIVKHWNLAEPMPADLGDDKRSSGMWRLTETGMEWITLKKQITKVLYIFDNKIIKEGGEVWSFIDALNKKFSYLDCTGINGGMNE